MIELVYLSHVIIKQAQYLNNISYLNIEMLYDEIRIIRRDYFKEHVMVDVIEHNKILRTNNFQFLYNKTEYKIVNKFF